MDACLHEQFAAIERAHWWFQGRREVVASVLRHRLDADRTGSRRIFDVGCGTGEMVDMLREFGEVTAIDPSADAVGSCRRRFGDDVEVRVRVGQIPGDLPEPGTFEVISAFDVLEHLEDDEAALRSIHGALPPGGVLVATVPAYSFLWGPHDVLSGHHRRYTRAELRRRLLVAGFSVDRISYFNTVLFPGVAGLRMLRRLRPGPASGPRSDFAMPPPLVNRLLRRAFWLEAPLLRVASLPFGVSILALAHKPTQP